MLDLLSQSAESAARRLEKLSGAPWALESTAIAPLKGGNLPAGFAQDGAGLAHGVHFSIPGAACLFSCSSRSREILVKAWLALCPGVSLTPSMESSAFAEIAGIAVNGLCDVLADSAEMAFILSPPHASMGALEAGIEGLCASLRKQAAQDELAACFRADLAASSPQAGCSLVVLLTSAMLDCLGISY